MKRIGSFCLALLLAFSLTGTAFAAGDGGKPVPSFFVTIYEAVCGEDPQENPPDGYTSADWEVIEDEDADSVELTGPNLWVSFGDESDPNSAVPLKEPFVGGQTYTALVTVQAMDGYCFDASTRVYTDDRVECRIVQRDRETLTVALEVKAEHDWDPDQTERTEPTCLSDGSEYRVCSADPSHTETEVLPMDPKAHAWGDWKVLKEATKTEEGEREHTCTLCGRVENEVIPKFTYPYTKVYEPETSWSMAATVAWRADGTALETAKAEVRPATAFIWLDQDLKVYDRDGGLLSEDLEAYVDATVSGLIPAFYIRDEATAKALKEWLPNSGLLDCFVVSTPENKEVVKDVADLLHIRGMLDYTSVKSPDRTALLDMIASTNGAHGKVILLSAQAATRENVRMLQSLASTVWVQTPADTQSLMTAYTNGVNGVVVDDFTPALEALEWFRDDAPSLLRIPFIIGHRGDPSTYVENTLDSANGAYEEGVDSVENDIHLSADGKLFIYHDDAANGLLGIVDPEDPYEPVYVESMTLETLRNHPFPWESILTSNEVLPEDSRYGTLYGQEEEKEYVVPTLEEYIEAFKDTGLVHDTEIKSENPDILPVYKAMVDEYDAWDQFFSITFNEEILDAVYRDYPEMSIGALGMGSWADVEYQDYDALADEAGAEAALKTLYGTIDRWNATYNNCYGAGWGREMVLAGRHRGLTTWPWTYRLSDPESFARDYLFGVTGLTGDYPWVASDYIVEISSADVTAGSADAIPKPQGTTQAGEQKTLENAELVQLEKLSDSKTLMIWRCREDLLVDGASQGSYYLYSNPFVLTERNSGGDSSVTYPITVKDAENGSVSASPAQAAQGEVVTLTVKPDEGYQIDQLTVLDQNGADVAVTEKTEGVYSFTMPASAVTVSAVFKGAAPVPSYGGCGKDASCPVSRFEDASPDTWYHDGVHWALEQGVMNGVSDTLFAPGGIATRAMVVTMLWRLEGEPEGKDNPFNDVSSDEWYGKAVSWAAENDVVNGTTATTFDPNAPVTREQLATILYRFAQSKGLGFTGLWSFSLNYSDAKDVSDFAYEPMCWMTMNGIITGMTDDTLAPNDNATRAQIATVFMRFCEVILKNAE